jgi:AbrB family looped-hinge helix DNA binding protein
MTVSLISSKGQITLPVKARRAAGLRPGDRVVVRVHNRQILIGAAPDFFAFKGRLGRAKPAAAERAAAQEAAAEAGRAGS